MVDMQRHNGNQTVLTAPDGSTKYLPSILFRTGRQIDRHPDQRIGLEVAERVDRHLASGENIFILHNQPINEGATS